MRWAYKTIHYGLKKDGLLGGSFLDEEEVEESLNDYGKAGWELVSLLEVRDGVIAVFKQPIGTSETSIPINNLQESEAFSPEVEMEEVEEPPVKPVIRKTVMTEDTPRPDYIIESDVKKEDGDAGAIKIE